MDEMDPTLAHSMRRAAALSMAKADGLVDDTGEEEPSTILVEVVTMSSSTDKKAATE